MIRKYKKQLSRNGWMSKLQRLCFGSRAPDFTGYCPFFWLTWFCLLFLPVLLLGRLVAIVVGFIVRLIADYMNAHPHRPSDKDLASFYADYLVRGADSLRDFQYEKIARWIRVTPDWENCARRALERRERKLTQVKQESAVVKRSANYLGYVVKPLLIAAALLVTYFVGKILYGLILSFTLAGLLTALKIVAGSFLTAGAAIGLVLGLSYLVRKCRGCPETPSWVWLLLTTAIDRLGVAAEFIEDTVEALYTAECPLIEWGEETRPIEKL